MKGKDLLFIAGGLGIAPLRSLFNYVLDNRKDYGNVFLFTDAKNQKRYSFGDELLALVRERC
jgi:sulfhydrogenase subunit gamma (sulfur reductase)